MKSSFWWSLLIVFPLIAPSIYAQNVPPVTMHRKQVAQFDAAGWTPAVSTDGKFSVQLPLRFNDFTMVDPNPQSSIDRIFSVGGESKSHMKFAAMRMTFDNKDGARQHFARIKAGETFPSTPSSIKPLKYNQSEAVDVVVTSGPDTAIERIVLIEPDLMTLIVQAPTPRIKHAMPFVDRFFNSLSVSRR